ncbi:hypothetical protein ACH3VS_16910 [Streptomyces sp. WSLK1-3]|uniref:hypothetical protein n=1 Tax=Streptomyces sp. WSLK1-3 TaxID=3375475 RepID=UPI0037A8FE72
MSATPPSEPSNTGQRNEGSGIFVGRDLIGNVVNQVRNVFIRSGHSIGQPTGGLGSARRSTDAEHGDIEEETPRVRFLATLFLAHVAFYGMRRIMQGEPLAGDGPTPSHTVQIFWLFFLGGGFIACVGYALACLAEILADWAQSAADSAVSNARRWRLAARTNTVFARGLARGSGATAAAASVVALVFGWCPLGNVISARAHHASDVAYAAVAEARAATRKRAT